MPQISAALSDDLDRRVRAFTSRYRRASGSEAQQRAEFVRAALKHFLESPELRVLALQKRISQVESVLNARLQALEAEVKALGARRAG
jgi:Arc/MetJ-type ribon-helix-helix transcriptional regulator